MQNLIGRRLSLALLLSFAPPALAQQATLHGEARSDREGPMEGVVVTATPENSTISYSVVTDEHGRFAFPAGRLKAGAYALTMRATGYDLAAPANATVGPDGEGSASLRLTPTSDIAKQLTSAEWLASMPGTDAQKQMLLNCTDCHTVERIVQSSHTAEEFTQVFERMAGYYPGAWPEQPQRLVGDGRRPPVAPNRVKEFSEYLASVNLSAHATHPYELKPVPRPSGRATRVFITEYALPRKIIQPHDVILDRDGMVWFSHFGEQFLSRLDPRTGKTTDFAIAEQKKGYPTGTLDLETDEDGNLWIGLMYQTGVARFDRKTETFTYFPLPADWQTNMTQQAHLSAAASKVDGKIWVKNSDRAQVMRLDPSTGKYENLGTMIDPAVKRPIGIYGISADQNNNAYILDYGGGNIGKIDAKTKAFSIYPTPTPNARARRGRVDAENRLWFAEYGGNAIGMFDPRTERMSEWSLKTPWSQPYDVMLDRSGAAWTGSVMSDRVTRLDTKTGEFIDYLMPLPTNIRRVYVDDTARPVAFWTGSDHGASIVKVEPLDIPGEPLASTP